VIELQRGGDDRVLPAPVHVVDDVGADENGPAVGGQVVPVQRLGKEAGRPSTLRRTFGTTRAAASTMRRMSSA